MLQLLDEGRLTDSQGRVVNFENTIIIMTSNAGSNLNTNGIGFNRTDSIAQENRVNDALKQTFRPEFLNRVDEIIPFSQLTKEELLQIVDLLLAKTQEALNSKEIILDVSIDAKHYLVDKGTDLKYGARPLRRAIQKNIEDPIAELILRGQVSSRQTIHVNVDGDNLKFDVN
jgi:ATP-dependent Clp protease ATP-binding subunit ClpA